jgi:oxygen-independent coproporphyrinogen-3 oxidase
MSGIYIHIPFCKKACIYCDFHFSTLKNHTEIINSILAEIDLNQKEFKKNNISTIYFGGGTPSIIDSRLINKVMQSILKNHSIKEECEITIEANPDDITDKNIKSWKKIGFNRISLGVQTFNDICLKKLNRIHCREDAISAVKKIKKEFKNYSIDIMFGTPGSTIETLREDLTHIKKLNPPHISIYSLDIENTTPLYKMIENNKIKMPTSSLVSEQFDIISMEMERMGYKKYRYWNVRDNEKYIYKINNLLPVFDKEELTEVQKVNEYILTKIRTMEGVNISDLEKIMGINLIKIKKREIQLLKDKLMIEDSENCIVLTKEGKKIIDHIVEKITI